VTLFLTEDGDEIEVSGSAKQGGGGIFVTVAAETGPPWSWALTPTEAIAFVSAILDVTAPHEKA
jgi:hypothetical protein